MNLQTSVELLRSKIAMFLHGMAGDPQARELLEKAEGLLFAAERETNYWKQQALRAEARYQQLHDDVRAARAQDMGMIIELADSRHFKTQARTLLVEAIALLDSIADADTEAQIRQEEPDE